MTSDELIETLRAFSRLSSSPVRPSPDFMGEVADALAAAQEEIERLTAELDELDFLRHEGGPDSVAGLETRVKALEAENERLREALEWQPIETAPRDGAVLLYFGNRQWRDMHDNTVRLPEPRNTIERIEAGWCEDGDIRESGTGHSVWEEWREPENFPTHWMPMPTPPRAALGKEG